MSRSGLLLLLIIYLGFISLGLPDGTFGVAWPEVYPELELPIGLAGAVAVLITLLSATTGFLSGRIIARFRTGPVVAVSCLLTGSALVLFSQAQGPWWLWLAAVPLGIGAGAVDAGLNGFVARHYSGRHMNWLHACWGVGATAGPLLMGFALRTDGGWRLGYGVLGSFQVGLAVIFVLTLPWWAAAPDRPAAGESRAGDTDVASGAAAPNWGANSWAGWLSPVLFAVIVAVETTAALWAGSILVVGRGFEPGVAAWCGAALFGAMTMGRILAGFVAERWGNRRLVALGLGGAMVGAVIFAMNPGPWFNVAALVVFGLGMAPLYPCLMHEVPRRFAADAAQTVIGRQSGAAYLGAAIMPTAAGALAANAIHVIPWLWVGGLALGMLGVRQLNKIT
ncbi:MFS transporter [Synoicihabitans lomoniglobus]|uniref:MFS transporter n=1 Tax=Synoicihabitans lomoniglobus TaxID=2909285 RepID=A0AAF0CQJ5_9BACT|nr:MFS transporter [Opitutaceae bacterium LMO-M01]WED66214.1 MFS transporter [Opitutaceae bacterium LMO-M01]